MVRLLAALPAALAALLLAAPAAFASGDHGEGLLGETNDQLVTNIGFILIAGIPLLVFLLSVLQWRLDKRKDERKKAAKARAGRQEWRGGW